MPPRRIDPIACEFKTTEEAEPCGSRPTRILLLGMTPLDPTKQKPIGGPADIVSYIHLCDEHYPVMEKRLGSAAELADLIDPPIQTSERLANEFRHPRSLGPND